MNKYTGKFDILSKNAIKLKWTFPFLYCFQTKTKNGYHTWSYLFFISSILFWYSFWAASLSSWNFVMVSFSSAIIWLICLTYNYIFTKCINNTVTMKTLRNTSIHHLLTQTCIHEKYTVCIIWKIWAPTHNSSIFIVTVSSKCKKMCCAIGKLAFYYAKTPYISYGYSVDLWFYIVINPMWVKDNTFLFDSSVLVLIRNSQFILSLSKLQHRVCKVWNLIHSSFTRIWKSIF